MSITISIMFTLRSGSYFYYNALPLLFSPPGAIACAPSSSLGIGGSRGLVVIISNFVPLFFPFFYPRLIPQYFSCFLCKHISSSYVYDPTSSKVQRLLTIPFSPTSLRALRINILLHFQGPEIIPLPPFHFVVLLLNPPLKQGTPLVKLRLWRFLSSYWNSEIAPVVADSYPLYIFSNTF